MNRIVVVIALLLAAPGLLWAGQVQTWRQETTAHFQAGKLTRLVITNEGRVQLSRQLKSLADVGATHVWKLALDASDNLYAVTGNPGLLLKIDPKGQVTKLHEDNNAQLFALAVAADGTVYAGVSPGGTIVRAKPAGGGVEALFATGETYVWGLSVDASGHVYAATGPNGKLFRVSPNGEGKLLFQAKQSHLLSLALAPSGVAYVGTNADGLIYKISQEGSVYVAYDASQSDIQTLLLTEDGTLYAGTGTPARPSLPSGAPSRPSGEVTLNNVPSLAGAAAAAKAKDGKDAESDKTAVAAADSSSSSSSSNSSDTPAASASSGMTKAAAGENSVYRIRQDGAVEEVFREKALVLSLAMQQDRLLVGTGQEGRLYDVQPSTRVQSEIARMEQGQINAMIRKADGSVVIGAGGGGKLYVLENQFTQTGTLLSEVLDAKMQTLWGKASWVADTPKGSELEITVRTGNVTEPDNTWSPWTNEASKLPLGRFFQYQAVFKSGDGKETPSLRDFTLYYATVNRAPKVESIEVPDLQKTPAPDANAKLKLKWKATDPNADVLSYLLEIKKDDWPEWVSLGKDLTKTEFEWDPGSMPGGNYRVRVSASDKTSNRKQDAMTGDKTSESFILDRETPSVKILVIKRVEKQLEVQCSGFDKRSRLTAAAYAIDGKEWVSLFPNDGLFDSHEEQITFTTDEVEPGSHVLVVRFKDSAGHLGVADTIVTVPK